MPKVDRTTPQQIDEQAVRWILRQEEGVLSCAARRRFEAWLKLPGRAQALQQMQELHEQLSQPWRRRRLAMRFAAYDSMAQRFHSELDLSLGRSVI